MLGEPASEPQKPSTPVFRGSREPCPPPGPKGRKSPEAKNKRSFYCVHKHKVRVASGEAPDEVTTQEACRTTTCSSQKGLPSWA